MIRNCDFCGKRYKADDRNIKRGWGLCCSKSCAARKREQAKPGYDSKRVAENNLKREGYIDFFDEYRRFPLSYDGADDDQWGDCDLGIHD